VLPLDIVFFRTLVAFTMVQYFHSLTVAKCVAVSTCQTHVLFMVLFGQ